MSSTETVNTDNSVNAVENGDTPKVLPRYFDLHVTGIGYLNRFRRVNPRRGDAFYAVTVAALHGESGACEYTYFDCKIAGNEAIERACALEADINAKRAVLVGFKLSDIYPETYEVISDQGKETRVLIKGRLLKINWAKVDGAARFASQPLTATGGCEVADEPRTELAQLGVA